MALDVKDLLGEEPEEVTPKTFEFLKSEAEIEKARETLNPEQAIVFDDILYSFLQDKSSYLVLVGYAGTGKTYTLSRVFEATTCRVAMTAPTNKAVKVLKENGNGQAEYATIYQLLALKVKMKYPPKGSKDEPKQIIERNMFKDPSITEYDVVVIDEASMLPDEIFEMIHQYEGRGIKFIFMGDPAQIPPVNKSDAIPLTEDGRKIYSMTYHELKTVMRQAEGNTILETAYSIRNNRFKLENAILDRTTTQNVRFLYSDDNTDKLQFVGDMLKLFSSDEFAKDPNYCKTIAWTNKTVDMFNAIIRSRIFKGKDIQPIMVGEQLIADKPIMLNNEILFSTSDEFRVVDYKDASEVFDMPTKVDKEKETQIQLGFDPDTLMIKSEDKKNQVRLDYYDCIVNDGFKDTHIHILKETSIKPLWWLLGKYKQVRQWKEWERIMFRFANVKFNYSITAHKAQGSTYGTVFLVEDDIDKNRKILERNRIKYTAVTRPKNNLYILSRRNRRQ